MKLKNKKTGEIGWLYCDHISIPKKMTVFSEDKDLSANHWDYKSLAELNEEWEDYEEPKEHWTIGHDGAIFKLSEWENQKDHEEIGNYFETKEEAEKAVERLKAFKRLKDKGFRFIDHIDRDSGQGMTRYEWDGYVNGEDLDLLFGGEE